MEQPTTPVQRTGEKTEMYPDGRMVTYYVDTYHTRWACTVATDGQVTWKRTVNK
jgi:hypothetical protein